MDAVIKSLHVHTQHAIEVSFRRVLCIAYVRNAGIIDQNVDTTKPENFAEPGNNLGLISNIAGVRRSSSSCARDFRCDGFGVLCADVDNVDSCTINSELVRNRPANPASAAGNNCSFSVDAKLAAASIFAGQRETPRFQGIKSS